MITRPLDLASKLRREPRSNDWLFFVNGGLLVLFFCLFGSPFVFAPSIPVTLPEIAGADNDARPVTHHITVSETGQIFVPSGPVNMTDFEKWLKDQIDEWKKQKSPPDPVLWAAMDGGVENRLQTQIAAAAYRAGFKLVVIAVREPKAASGGR